MVFFAALGSPQELRGVLFFPPVLGPSFFLRDSHYLGWSPMEPAAAPGCLRHGNGSSEERPRPPPGAEAELSWGRGRLGLGRLGNWSVSFLLIHSEPTRCGRPVCGRLVVIQVTHRPCPVFRHPSSLEPSQRYNSSFGQRTPFCQHCDMSEIHEVKVVILLQVWCASTLVK